MTCKSFLSIAFHRVVAVREDFEKNIYRVLVQKTVQNDSCIGQLHSVQTKRYPNRLFPEPRFSLLIKFKNTIPEIVNDVAGMAIVYQLKT